MSARMLRMLKWLAANEVNQATLRKANQTTLRGLALRGLVSQNGITPAGMAELASFTKAEFIQRKSEKDLSNGVMAAIQYMRILEGRERRRK